MKSRNFNNSIANLALDRKKMAFISGPRQCGKTTLAKDLIDNKKNYFNWDDPAFKKLWSKSSADFVEKILQQPHPRIVLDEIHKNPNWKNQVKAFYDQYADVIQIILTGSAQLNVFRKGADSLMGRFVHFNLHPFSLGELQSETPLSFKDFSTHLSALDIPSVGSRANKTVEQLLQFSGFPEPFLAGRDDIYKIWSKNRLDLLIRQDIPEQSQLLRNHQVDVLSLLLPDKVGSPLSVQSLREDLDVAHTTVTRWLTPLEQVYYHFEVKPFSVKIARSLKKEAKIYLFDWAQVESEGARFENMVACHLKKMTDFYNDTGQADLNLCYLRDKEKNEVDFLITENKKPLFSVEVKLSELNLDSTFKKFQKNYKFPHFQIVKTKNIHRRFKSDNAAVISFENFFNALP